jgi:hypothetical protein
VIHDDRDDVMTLRHGKNSKRYIQIEPALIKSQFVNFLCLTILFCNEENCIKTRIKINKVKATFTGRSPRHTQEGHPEDTQHNNDIIWNISNLVCYNYERRTIRTRRRIKQETYEVVAPEAAAWSLSLFGAI